LTSISSYVNFPQPLYLLGMSKSLMSVRRIE
jgi:hypothetical protein